MAYFFIFLFGTVLGSFFNVCIYRIPRSESVVFPASHCIYCNKHLKIMDLIPILSFLLLKGKCRYCSTKISIRYPLIELLTGIVYLILFIKFGFTWIFIIYIILCSILIILSFIDLDYQVIPDGLILIGLFFAILFIIFNLAISLKEAFLGALVGGGTLLLIGLLSVFNLKKEGMGGGDIKLMTVIGLFLGFKQTFMALIFSIYIGGLIGIILLIFKVKKKDDHIAFGPIISLGTFFSILFGNDILNWYIKSFAL